MRKSLLTSSSSESSQVQNATQTAPVDNWEAGSAPIQESSALHQMELAALRLVDAAEYLENLLQDLPPGSEPQNDIHDALSRIMETQMAVASAHSFLCRNLPPEAYA